MKPTFEIDFDRISNFEEFVSQVSRMLGISWNGNLDAFNDYLRGDMGTPEGGFILRWKNSSGAREMLGRVKSGEFRFDVLLEIIRMHGPGGSEAEDGIELERLS